MNLATRDNEALSLETFGGRMKAVRLAKGLKLGFTARQIGLSRTSLNQWESDSVKNPDMEKLIAFTKLTDVSLDWLAYRKGGDPDFTTLWASVVADAMTSGSSPRHPSTRMPRQSPLRELYVLPGNHDAEVVPEITASLTAHASRLDLTPRAVWGIPTEVQELGFHGVPGKMVMQRVLTRDGEDFALKRGDYVLIDTSRNRIDEPGIYLLADPAGLSARRVLVTSEGNTLKIELIADDINRPGQIVSTPDADVLGRVMGLFQPI